MKWKNLWLAIKVTFEALFQAYAYLLVIFFSILLLGLVLFGGNIHIEIYVPWANK